MSSGAELLLNIASAAGIGVLSVPAFSLNFRKKALARIANIVRRRTPGEEKKALDTIAVELEAEAAQRANKWRKADEVCLFIGYFLLLGASILRVILAWQWPIVL